MTPTSRCPHCDTALSYALPDGARFVFTAHTPEYCAAATRDRVRLLVRAIESLHETYAHHLRHLHAHVDRQLQAAGAPALDHAQRERDVAELRRRLALLPVAPTADALRDLESRPWRVWAGDRWRDMSEQEFSDYVVVCRGYGVSVVVDPRLAPDAALDPGAPVAVRSESAAEAVRRAHDRWSSARRRST